MLRRTGRLRHRIEIQGRLAGTGSRGEATGSWSKVGERWAEITGLGGDEAERARKLYANARFSIRFRAFSDLTTKHRIKFGSRTFEIGYIDDTDQFGDEHIALCAEVT